MKEKFGLFLEFFCDFFLFFFFSEYNDCFKFEEMFRGVVFEFEIFFGKMLVNFSNFECKLEGVGVLMYL